MPDGRVEVQDPESILLHHEGPSTGNGHADADGWQLSQFSVVVSSSWRVCLVRLALQLAHLLACKRALRFPHTTRRALRVWWREQCIGSRFARGLPCWRASCGDLSVTRLPGRRLALRGHGLRLGAAGQHHGGLCRLADSASGCISLSVPADRTGAFSRDDGSAADRLSRSLRSSISARAKAERCCWRRSIHSRGSSEWS